MKKQHRFFLLILNFLPLIAKVSLSSSKDAIISSSASESRAIFNKNRKYDTIESDSEPLYRMSSFPRKPRTVFKHKLSNINQGFSDEISSEDSKRFQEEKRFGDLTRLLGNNVHTYEPNFYSIHDLGRRSQNAKEDNFDKNVEKNGLTPMRASSELVLAVAKASDIINDVYPDNFNEEMLEKKALRSGNYWNSYWKEDEEPLNVLRTSEGRMESLVTKLKPGSPIYDYISKLNKDYPLKLLYMVNKN